MYKNITGVILSGGKSSRMGTNKSLLRIGNDTIIGRITELLKSLFTGVIIVTNEPELYGFLNVKIVEDIFKNYGPLSGIHSGLVHSQTDQNFIISCDLPFFTREAINYLVEFKSNNAARYYFANGQHQPLAGVYSKILILQIEKMLTSKHPGERKQEHLSIRRLLQNIEADVINAEELSFCNNELFFNLNSPDDAESLKSKWQY